MIKCFAYLRVSSAGQAKDGKDGFPRQLKAVEEYARANKLQIEAVYKEHFTGIEIDRPILAEQMVSLEQNGHGIKTVLIERLDRLARDVYIQESIIRDFHSKGFTLISALEPDLCNDDPTRNLLRVFMGAIAEYDKKMLVAKLRAARERKRAAGGKAEGQLGYKDTISGRATLEHIRALYRKPKRDTVKPCSRLSIS